MLAAAQTDSGARWCWCVHECDLSADLGERGCLTCRRGHSRCGATPSVGGALPGVPQTSDGGEGWLLGVLGVVSEDQHATFWTLCVLLWLLCLTVL